MNLGFMGLLCYSLHHTMSNTTFSVFLLLLFNWPVEVRWLSLACLNFQDPASDPKGPGVITPPGWIISESRSKQKENTV